MHFCLKMMLTFGFWMNKPIIKEEIDVPILLKLQQIVDRLNELSELEWLNYEVVAAYVYIPDITTKDYWGQHKCLICGEDHGSRDIMIQGKLKIPESLLHYVAKHNITIAEPVIRDFLLNLDVAKLTLPSKNNSKLARSIQFLKITAGLSGLTYS
jgi:hypothetical protein